MTTFAELEQKRQTPQGLTPAEKKQWEVLFNQNDYAIEQVFRVPVDGKVAIANQANRRIIRQWAEGEIGPITSIEAWFAKIFRENPSLARQLAWQDAKALDPAYQAELAKKHEKELRARFLEVCKTHGLASSEANFNIWSNSCNDPVVSWFNSKPVIVLEDGTTLDLTPAPQDQKDEWREQAEKKAFQAKQDHLRHLVATNDVAGLRKAAAEETQQKQLTAFEKNRNYRMLKGFIVRGENLKQPLPESWLGKPLTADTIKRGGVDIIREIGKQCGFERINALIYQIPDIEDFFSDAESKLRALAAEEYHEISWSR